MAIIYFIYGAFGRVWFGSDLTSKIWGNRALQTSFLLAGFLSIFVKDWTCILALITGILMSCWMQFQEISRGHGIGIDTGESEVDLSALERYMERWYYKLCDKLIPEQYRFGFLYDNLWLFLRYTCPLTVPALWYKDPRFLLLGLSIPFIYTFCNKLEEKDPWVFEKKYWWWRRGWSLAEILSGGVIMSGCYLLVGIK